MSKDVECRIIGIPRSIDISDDDIFEAMKEIDGYLDITPGDFREVYRIAYDQAVKRLTQSVKARDVMTRKVIFAVQDTPSRDVALAMGRHRVSGLPVMDHAGRVVGVISEKDFLRHMGAGQTTTFMEVVAECLKGKGCVALQVRGQRAVDIMTSPAITVDEETPIMTIADIFMEKGINRVPVINRQGELVGIISRDDILQSILIKK